MTTLDESFFTREEDLHFRRTVWLLSVLTKAERRKASTSNLQHLLGEMLFLTNILVRKHEVVAAMALRNGAGLVVQNLEGISAGLESPGLEGPCLIARNFRRYIVYPSPTRVRMSDLYEPGTPIS
jgi:hypothetical protein